jgi:hypothetical protein
VAELTALARRVREMLVVEMSAGQLLEDVRLAAAGACQVGFLGRTGGMVPTPGEVLESVWSLVDPAADPFGPDPLALLSRAPGRDRGNGLEGDDDDADPLGLLEAGAWWLAAHGGSPT